MKTIIVVSLSFFIVFISHQTFAQEVNWREISNFNVVGDLVINTSDHIFVSSGSSTYRSTDDGKNWTRLFVDSTGSIGSLTINSNGDIYGISNQGILRSTDNGDSWKIVLHRQYGDWYGMVSNSAGYIFVANCFGGVLRSTDNGNSWKQVLDSADVHGIVIGSSEEIIAADNVTTPRGGPTAGYRSTDNGESWQKYAYGFTSLAYNSSGMMFASNGAIFCSTNKGETWEMKYEKSDRGVNDIVINTNDQIFAGCSFGGIITSMDNGVSWKELNVGLIGEYFKLEKNSKGVVFVGTENGLFRSVKTTPIALINSDFYVHPAGQDTNSGFIPSKPLKSIADALSRIYADSLNPHMVHIANGNYDINETGEAKRINLRSYVSLIGESEDSVILNGSELTLYSTAGISIKNMTLKNSSVFIGNCHPTLEHLTFQEGHYGIWLSSSNAYIRDVRISGTKDMGGILMGGSSPTLYNVSLTGNNGWLSGGIRIEEHSSPILVNVTITGNKGGEMGGINCNDGSNPILINTVIWNNSKPEIELRPITDCSITFANCDLQGGKGQIQVVSGGIGTINWLEGNLDIEPLFLDAKNGDYRLQNGSPCIDAGIPLFIWKGDTVVNIKPDQYIGSAPDIGAFEFGKPTGIEKEPTTPQTFALSQNYPNPFNPSTTIKYQIPKQSFVTLRIFDLLGREVATLVNERKDAGTYSVQWNASGFSSGIYFYQLQANGKRDIKKMVLIK
jgi:photosystem II stability/assembly factor-like uncharacterized protein